MKKSSQRSRETRNWSGNEKLPPNSGYNSTFGWLHFCTRRIQRKQKNHYVTRKTVDFCKLKKKHESRAENLLSLHCLSVEQKFDFNCQILFKKCFLCIYCRYVFENNSSKIFYCYKVFKLKQGTTDCLIYFIYWITESDIFLVITLFPSFYRGAMFFEKQNENKIDKNEQNQINSN